jgi:uncharacterized membrane protein
VLLYVVVFSALSVVRYNASHGYTFDLGITTQVVWNTAYGRWLETSLGRAANVELIGSYLGNHVRPILLLLASLYRLWPDPRLLLILQSVALGVAAVPLYWIARHQAGNSTTALIVACCYLAYPALGFLNLFDIHPIAFSIPFIFLAYWARLEERTALFWIAVLLALFTKEEMVIPIATWGLVNLLQREKRRIGLGLLTLAGAWAVLCFGLVIPYFNEGQPYRFWQLWSHLPGLSAQASVQGGTAQPVTATSPETIILFLLHLALPLGFLSFLGPASLVVAFPSLAYLLLGKRSAFHSVGYQYPAVLIPWFFLAVVEGLQRLRAFCLRLSGPTLYWAAIACMLVGTVATNCHQNPIAQYTWDGAFRCDPYHDQIVEALAQIPPEAGVATINRLGPSLAHRRILVALEYPPPFRLDHVQMADYVLLDLVDCRAVVAPDPRAEYTNIVMQVLQTGHFRVRYWSGRILLLERGTALEGELTTLTEYVAGLAEQNRPCWP